MIDRKVNNKFKTVSKYQPSGINRSHWAVMITSRCEKGKLNGATGTGKTYTMSQVIARYEATLVAWPIRLW